MPMEEPTTAELIRDVQEACTRIEHKLTTFVTRELYEERHTSLERRVAHLEQARDARARTAWTAFIGPAVVGVVLLLIQSLQGAK